MCVVSMVGDFAQERWPKVYPNIFRPMTGEDFKDPVSREEFDALRREVQMIKELLEKAKEYDERTNQPNCELDEKIALLKKVADLVGIDIKI